MKLSEKILQGDARAVAKLITMVEDDFQKAQPILEELHSFCGQAIVIGITGPPGSGKSTITDKITKYLRKMGKKVGIIAIDPSSPFSGGAILGDRIRMQDLTTDKEVFIRSVGARGHLGGLSRSTQAVVKIMDAMGKDFIFIETVGVGQSEIDVIKVSDIVLLIVMPGMGDDIQVIKAGIMEIGDIFVVNKADREGSDKLIAEIEMMLHLNGKEEGWNPPILKTIGTENVGFDLLWKEIENCIDYLKKSGKMYQRRKNRTRKEIYDLFQESWREMFFQFIGEDRIEKEVEKVLKQGEDPYHSVKKLSAIFKENLSKGGKVNKLLKKIDHIGVAVKNLEDSLHIFRDVLGMKCLGEEVVAEQNAKVAFLPVGESEIELLESTSSEGSIAKYIEKRGEGIHHIAFEVEDLDSVLKELQKKGVQLIDEEPRYGAGGARIAFLHPKSTNSILVELCEHKS